MIISLKEFSPVQWENKPVKLIHLWFLLFFLTTDKGGILWLVQYNALLR